MNASKVNSILPTQRVSDNELIQFRQAYRTAVEGKHIHGLKLAAIVAQMRAKGCDGMTETYFYKLYDGTRPLTAEYIVALPDSVNALFYKILAEQHEGQIVITPAAPGIEAVKSFVSGLLGMQMPQLPAKAGPPAKAELSTAATPAVPRVGGARQ